MIKKKREEKGLSQAELAVWLGIHRSTVAKWETGRSHPSVEVLLKLSVLFGCTVDELLKGE